MSPFPPSNPTSLPGAVTLTRPASTRGFPIWVVWLLLLLGLATAGGYVFFWHGTISLSATPVGSSITIDEVSGVDRLTVTLAPGTYPITVTAPGYITYHGSATLKPGQTTEQSVALRPIPAPVRLSEQHIQFLELDSERTSLLYLEPSSQTIFRLVGSNPTKPTRDPITPNRFSDVTDITWSPNRQLALYRAAGHLRLYDFNRYDLVNQTVSDWPAEIGSVVWQPNGEQVIYFYSKPSTGERTLVRATKDNTEPERIFNFEGTDLTNPTLVAAPNGKTIALLERTVSLFDVFSKQVHPIDAGGAVTALRWSPTSDRLFYETSTGLGMIALDGTVTPLPLTASLGQLTPTSDGSALIVLTGRGQTATLIRFNLSTLTESPLPLATLPDLAADSLLLGSNDAVLYFTNAGQPFALTLDDGAYRE